MKHGPVLILLAAIVVAFAICMAHFGPDKIAGHWKQMHLPLDPVTEARPGFEAGALICLARLEAQTYRLAGAQLAGAPSQRIIELAWPIRPVATASLTVASTLELSALCPGRQVICTEQGVSVADCTRP